MSKMPFEQYVARVLRHLPHVSEERRAAIVRELYAHLEDAATVQATRLDDHGFQRAVVRQLGSSRRLGRALARVHDGNLARLQSTPRRFVAVWVALHVIAWIVGLSDAQLYLDTNELIFPISAGLAGLVSALALPAPVGQRSSKAWWMIASVWAWVWCAWSYSGTDWAYLQESQAEQAILGPLLGAAILTGFAQSLVLARHVQLWFLWAAVPATALVAGFILSLMLNFAVYDLGQALHPNHLAVFQPLYQLIFGTIIGGVYGAITGVALLVLSSLGTRDSQQLETKV